MGVLMGHRGWNLNIDEKRHRTYKVKWVVLGGTFEGPASIVQSIGLPQIGDPWVVGIPGAQDVDLFAWRHPQAVVSPFLSDEAGQWWTVEQTFSTASLEECQTAQFEDPLLEPPIFDGTFQPDKREASNLRSSSHEMIRGVELDDMKQTIQITMNVVTLPLSKVNQLKNRIHNGSTLFGLPGNEVKFSEFQYSQQFFGTCGLFYTVTFGFWVDDWNGKKHDDWGTRVLHGRPRIKEEGKEDPLFDPCGNDHPTWFVLPMEDGSCPDADNPMHFVELKDVFGGRYERMPLKDGLPARNIDDVGEMLHSNAYLEGNLLELGIPSVIPGAI